MTGQDGHSGMAEATAQSAQAVEKMKGGDKQEGQDSENSLAVKE